MMNSYKKYVSRDTGIIFTAENHGTFGAPLCASQAKSDKGRRALQKPPLLPDCCSLEQSMVASAMRSASQSTVACTPGAGLPSCWWCSLPPASETAPEEDPGPAGVPPTTDPRLLAAPSPLPTLAPGPDAELLLPPRLREPMLGMVSSCRVRPC